jgi:phosphoenolpyruvate-protein kinase (PTS system EI component)
MKEVLLLITGLLVFNQAFSQVKYKEEAKHLQEKKELYKATVNAIEALKSHASMTSRSIGEMKEIVADNYTALMKEAAKRKSIYEKIGRGNAVQRQPYNEASLKFFGELVDLENKLKEIPTEVLDKKLRACLKNRIIRELWRILNFESLLGQRVLLLVNQENERKISLDYIEIANRSGTKYFRLNLQQWLNHDDQGDESTIWINEKPQLTVR